MKRFLDKTGNQGRSKRGRLVVFAALCLVSGVAIIYQQTRGAEANVASVTIAPEACKLAEASNLKCQQEYYKQLYMQQGSKATFASLRAAYNADPFIKSSCHQLVHAIGRVAADKYGDVAKAYAEGDNFCWSGYYHGVMESLLKKLGDKSLVENLNTICEPLKQKAAYSFDHYNCAHGLGHGIMLVEADELFKSLTICDNLTDSWERESCYGGVFMENIMASINPDHHTHYIKHDDPLYPCTAVDEQYKNQCYLMQTSQALTVLKQDFAKVFQLCSTVPGSNKLTCYQSLGRDASGNSVSDVNITYDTCMKGPNREAVENCMIGAVKDFVSFHHDDKQATILCEKFEPVLEAVCTDTKQQYYASFR